MTTREPDTNGGRSAEKRRAGAYGFSRHEIGALLLVALIAGGFGLFRWWQRQVAPGTSPWVIENIVIESDAETGAAPRSGSADSNRTGALHTALPDRVVDINAAPAAELVRLPGIGPVLADRIIDERERAGPFRDLNDLRRVPGIGAGKVRDLAGWVTFDPPVRPDTAAKP